MKMLSIFITTLMLGISHFSYALERSLPINYFQVDGIHAASDGRILAASGYAGHYVLTINSDGTTGVLAQGLNGPIDIAEDSAGNFFITNFNDGNITKVTPDGETSVFATVSAGPAGIVADANDNLYIAHYGDFSGNGNQISKVTPNGEVSIHSQGDYLQAPVALTMDDEGNLYTANFNEGSVIMVDTEGNQTLITQIPSATGYAVGHMEYVAGRLFATSLVDQAVYVISKRGNVRNFRAKLDNTRFPNGLTFDATTSRLYFTYAFSAINKIDYVQLRGARLR